MDTYSIVNFVGILFSSWNYNVKQIIIRLSAGFNLYVYDISQRLSL